MGLHMNETHLAEPSSVALCDRVVAGQCLFMMVGSGALSPELQING